MEEQVEHNDDKALEGKNWYVIKVVSGQEKKIKTYIENEVRRYSHEDAVEKVLVVLKKVYEVKGGKKRMSEKNFFPGYVLLCGDLSDAGEAIHTIHGIPGVLGFLGAMKGGSRPSPLRKDEVQRILGSDESTNKQEEVPFESLYMVDETVKVIDGPFSGFEAVIEKIHEDRKKLEVIVKIFGRNTPIQLNYYQVDKVS